MNCAACNMPDIDGTLFWFRNALTCGSCLRRAADAAHWQAFAMAWECIGRTAAYRLDAVADINEKTRLRARIAELEASLDLMTTKRNEARTQQKYAWERHAEKDRAYQQALDERDAARSASDVHSRIAVDALARAATAERERDAFGTALEDIAVFLNTDKYAARENTLAMVRAALAARRATTTAPAPEVTDAE